MCRRGRGVGPRVSLQHLLGKLGSRARPRSVIGLSWKRPRKSWFFPAWHPGPSPAAPRYLWLKIGAPGLGPAVNMGVSQCRGLGTCSGRAQDVGVSRALRGDGARRAGGWIHQHRQRGGREGETERERERDGGQTGRLLGTEGPDRGVASAGGGRGLNQMEAGSPVGEVPSTRQKLERCLPRPSGRGLRQRGRSLIRMRWAYWVAPGPVGGASARWGRGIVQAEACPRVGVAPAG